MSFVCDRVEWGMPSPFPCHTQAASARVTQHQEKPSLAPYNVKLEMSRIQPAAEFLTCFLIGSVAISSL